MLRNTGALQSEYTLEKARIQYIFNLETSYAVNNPLSHGLYISYNFVVSGLVLLTNTTAKYPSCGGRSVNTLTLERVNHFYWPTNALNCIKLKRLKSTCINILKGN